MVDYHSPQYSSYKVTCIASAFGPPNFQMETHPFPVSAGFLT